MTFYLSLEKKKLIIITIFKKKKVGLIFVDDIILPEWREEGVRLDTNYNYPLDCENLEYIRCENTNLIIGQLKCLRSITRHH